MKYKKPDKPDTFYFDRTRNQKASLCPDLSGRLATLPTFLPVSKCATIFSTPRDNFRYSRWPMPRSKPSLANLGSTGSRLLSQFDLHIDTLRDAPRCQSSVHVKHQRSRINHTFVGNRCCDNLSMHIKRFIAPCQ